MPETPLRASLFSAGRNPRLHALSGDSIRHTGQQAVVVLRCPLQPEEPIAAARVIIVPECGGKLVKIGPGGAVVAIHPQPASLGSLGGCWQAVEDFRAIHGMGLPESKSIGPGCIGRKKRGSLDHETATVITKPQWKFIRHAQPGVPKISISNRSIAPGVFVIVSELTCS